jgi:hypothetical protein
VVVTCAEGTTARGVLTVYKAQTRRKPVGGAETGGGGSAPESVGLVPLAVAAVMLSGVGAAAARRRAAGRRG